MFYLQQETKQLKLLLNTLKIPAHSFFIEKQINEHPYSGSIQCITDTLAEYSVGSLAIKIPPNKLEEIPYPALAQIKTEGKNGNNYLLLDSYNNQYITYQKTSDKSKKVSISNFLKRWTGVIILVSDEIKSRETLKSDFEEKLQTKVLPIILSLFVLLILSFFNVQILPILLIKFAGIIISWILMKSSIGDFNIQALCRTRKNVNCESILQSKVAKPFPWLSLSELGIIYFLGSVLALSSTVFNRGSGDLLNLIAIISFASLPMIVFSIYYQWRVVKQWCILCLLVQLILALEIAYFIFVIEADFPLITVKSVSLLLTGFGIAAFVWFSFKPFYLDSIENVILKRQLGRLQRNTTVFESLLNTTRKNTQIEPSFTIIQKNLALERPIITLITKPNCKPCRKAHKEIDLLIQEFQNEVTFQFVFTSPNTIAEHIHCLYQKDQKNAIEAMHSWYTKEYNTIGDWLSEFPLQSSSIDDSQLEEVQQALLYQKNWCIDNQIKATPTVLYNYRKLPEQYQLKDLKYILRQY